MITTHYDILAERGIRNERRPRAAPPGFSYGDGAPLLRGGGYPSFTHIKPLVANGDVPRAQMHGSVSWADENGELIRYHDCRPAIRGDALIVAPVRAKQPPHVSRLYGRRRSRRSPRLGKAIVVAYSLPDYDEPRCAAAP